MGGLWCGWAETSVFPFCGMREDFVSMGTDKNDINTKLTYN